MMFWIYSIYTCQLFLRCRREIFGRTFPRVAGGGWRVTGDGWRVTGSEWRVTGSGWRVTGGGWRVNNIYENKIL